MRVKFIVDAQLPKKLVLVKTGNITNKNLLTIFEKNIVVIVLMLEKSSLIEVGANEIVEHS